MTQITRIFADFSKIICENPQDLRHLRAKDKQQSNHP